MFDFFQSVKWLAILMDNQGSIYSKGSDFSLCYYGRLCGSPSVLSNGSSFSGSKVAGTWSWPLSI
jgi:hypothetical protein